MRGADHKKIAILGSGIVALIAGRIIDKSIIITRKRDNLHLKNVYVHDTSETRSFLRLFAKFPIKKQAVEIFYFNHENGRITKSISDDERKILILEKMGNPNFKIEDISISTTKDLENDKLWVLNYDDIEFEKKLFRDINIIEWPFHRVEEKDSFVRIYGTDNLYLDYDYVINTIPQNFFTAYTNEELPFEESKYKSLPITFVTGENFINEDVIGDYVITGKDYMIYGFNGEGFKRIFRNGGKTLIEYNGDSISDELIKSDFPSIQNINKKVLPYGRIVSKKVEDSNRIINVGRFAQWDHSITLEHSIQKLLSLDL